MIIKNLADILSFQVRNNPKKIAIYTKNSTISFFELEEYVCKTANYLKNQNIKPKDVVLHYFDDEFLLAVTMLALAKIGACLVSISKNSPKNQLNEIYNLLNPKYILSNIDIKLDFKLKNLIFTNKTLNSLENSIYEDEKEFDSNLIWQIVIGSGTTGKPKFFEVSHKLEFERVKISQSSIDTRNSDRVLSLLELLYNSTKIRFLMTLYSGASYIIWDKKDSDFVSFCKKYQVSILFTTVFHIESILKTFPNIKKESFSFLRVLSIGASNISDDLRKRIKEKFTSNLYVTYGTNEVGGITCADKKSVFDVSQTVGKVLKNVLVQIVDKTGKELEIGEVGYVRVKSLGMINGYLNDEESTKRAFKDGWYYPLDLGKFTKEKELIYCGRADDMMIMNGINIYPAQIENQILYHKAVKDVCVVSFKHKIHQDIPICAIVLKENKKVSKNELIRYCIENLGFQAPKDIIFLDKIPKNEQGKIVKSKLKEKIVLDQIQKKSFLNYNLNFEIEQKIDLNNLKMWFKEVLNIDILEIEDKNPLIVLSKYSTTLAKELFFACNIPIFKDIEILSLNLDETQNRYILTLSCEYIDFIPINNYNAILNNSLNYVLYMLTNPITVENKKLLLDSIFNLINQILLQMPIGKSTIHILKEAFKKDIPFFHLGDGVYQLGLGSKSIKLDRSTTNIDSAIGSKLSQNKVFTANLLKLAALPSPIHGVTNSKDEALQIARQINFPLVVKPVDLDRGEGVSVNILNEDELLKAFDLAYNLSKRKQVIVEKQVSGVCHRLFIVDDKLLYAVKRLPICVIADGYSSIEKLIEKANQKEALKMPWDSTKLFYPIDELSLKEIEKSSYNLKSIPLKDTIVPLRDIESTKWGGYDEDVTNIVHPENLKIALQTTKIFELQVAGIDIITSDISEPWYETDTIINEVNFAPLLGGGDISKQNIGKYLDLLLKDSGKIEVEVYNNYQDAMYRQNELILGGTKAYFVSEEKVFDFKKELVFFKNHTIFQKIKALFLNKSVDFLVIFE
ncbi:AMP-binding protein [Aliarcobacter cryaerophilus]|uniref:AMP-binding protein n=1 Tax=Aliarcobacter cryaerophilus TaxID=28198 RepID=UPI0021B622D6|nr:AMP-binding protein [Aliarcobacter cryaerophilus]MCT7485573.1 AMP-binding protein [Aliarcobacter cryaerophilus]MCT7491340.1 AMP-binding protein [Aliarcobacter cryaerophilus]